MNMLLAQSASLDVATSEGLGIIAKFGLLLSVGFPDFSATGAYRMFSQPGGQWAHSAFRWH
jgi:hypothetical protein